MKKILCSLIVLISFSTSLSADADKTNEAGFSIAGEFEPSSYVNNSVNAITGSFFHTTKDLTVPGPAPMDLLRYTNSEIFNFHFLGRGMSTNFPHWIKGKVGKFRKTDFVQVQEDGGSVLEYVAKYDDRYLEFFLDPEVIHAGLTNCGSYEISARTNLKNSYYSCDISKEGKVEWKGYLANGTLRRYYKTYDFDDSMNLKEEAKANGLKLYYDYHHDGKLKEIELRDSQGKDVLNWLKFEHSDKGKKVTVTSSNGKSVEYKLKEKWHKDDFYYYVEKVNSTDGPTVYYDYDTIDDKPHFGRISWPEGRFLENDYDHKGRVTAQKAPVGENGEKRTIWEFDYNSHDRYTKVKDGLGRKSIYHYSKHNRLKSLEKYLAGNLFLSDCFFWGQKEKIEKAKRDYNEEGHLLAKARCSADGKAKYLKHFTYDKFGNITEEVAFGCFTGKGPESFWLTSDGFPKEDGVDWYKKTYTYSNDRFHLKLSEKEEDGLTYEYQYKPGTDLVIAKFTCDGSDIKIREFFEYDHATCLIKKIIDDGSSHDPNNLKNVTERKITTIIPVKQRGSHGVGQPEAIIESYLNLNNNKVVQVKRINFTYDYAGNIKTEEVLDGHDKHLYSLKYSHNSMGRLVHFFDAEGNEFIYDYDANGNKIREEQIGSGFYITYEYDKANRLICEIEHHADIGDFETSYAYDIMGNKVLQIDHFGNETRYEYDDLNRLIKVILPQISDENGDLSHPIITKEYDIFDNVVAETDPNGNTTRYKYNSRNQPLKITYADGSKEEFEYNRNGTLACKWDKNGTKTTYSYDFLKRVTKVHVYDQTDNQLFSTTNSYSAFHLLSSTDPMGSTDQIQL